MAAKVKINYNCFMNEHIKSNKVANMCYTTLMTKKSHGSWKLTLF